MNANATSSPMVANSPFKPMVPHQAVATLLLIENSQAMSYIWPDLRDRYLQSLLSRFETNPAVPITTLVLESLPLQAERIPAVPRQYNVLQNGLQDFRFNCDPNNRLSVGKISSGADILASTKFQGQPVARHLIIVAASTPVADTTGIDLSSFIGRTPWYQLAQKFAQADIQCHMVVGPNEDMAPLMTLFEETLRLQNYVEESPSFPVDRTKMLFRLSAKPSHTFHSNAAPFPKRGLPPRRSHTYHGDTYSRPPDEGTLAPSLYNEPPTDPPPSLVSQLQQVHGLTKKKVYGTKPARMPFFRDERVRDKRAATLPQATPALASPVSIAPLPSAGGRAVSRSRAERIIRVAGGSPTEPHPRRHGSRRGSRLSSPESESLALPAAYALHPSLTQTSPIANADAYMQTGHHDAAPLHGEANVVPEPTWLQPQYPSVIPSISQTQFSPAFMGSQVSQPTYAEPRWQPGEVSAGVAYSQQIGPLEGSTMVNHAPLPLHRSPHHDVGGFLQFNGGSHENITRPRSSRVSAPGDEVPFTFDAEYVAATTALFNSEVLPAYPNFAAMSEPVRSMKNPDPPRRSFYFNSDQDSLPPSPSSPSYNTGELYGTVAHHVDDILHPSLAFEYPMDSPLSYATSYSPGSSSSLTGWAG